MGCIALTGHQKNILMSHLFLASMGAGDPVECSGFEKLITNWIKPLLDIVSNFFFSVKLGSTLIPDYIAEEILNKNVNILKTDLTKFAEYTGVVTKTYEGLNRDERGWSWAEGFHWFLNHNFVHNNKYPYKQTDGTGMTVNDLQRAFETGKLHPYQLNFITWVKSWFSKYGNGNGKFSSPAEHLKATLKGYLPNTLQNQQSWSNQWTWKYINSYIFPAVDWIANLNMKNLDPAQREKTDHRNENNGSNLPIKSIASLAAVGLLWGKLK